MKNIYVKTLFFLLLLLGVVGYAQTVSGLVTSDDGPLPGATIIVKGTNNGGNPEHIFSVNYDEATGGGMNFSQMALHYSSQFTWNLEAQPWNGYAAVEDF